MSLPIRSPGAPSPPSSHVNAAAHRTQASLCACSLASESRRNIILGSLGLFVPSLLAGQEAALATAAAGLPPATETVRESYNSYAGKLFAMEKVIVTIDVRLHTYLHC